MPHADPLRARGRRRIRSRCGALSQRPPQPVEIVEEPPGRARVPEPLPRALERLREALAADRLQQVVERPHLEGRHRVAVERGDEDDVRDVARPPQHVEAGAFGHLHIEEAEVGDGLVEQPHRRFRIGRLARELEVRMRRQQSLHPFPRRPLVVDDDAAMPHAPVSPAGSVSRARAPPPGADERARAARLP